MNFGNLVFEKTKNKIVDYQYNELNQLTKKKEGNESYSYTYDKRGNRVEETGGRKRADLTCMTRQTARRKASTGRAVNPPTPTRILEYKTVTAASTVYDLEGFSPVRSTVMGSEWKKCD